MLSNNLREHQIKAIEISIKNDFESGVYSHATGTGKSWIALELILKYHQYYPNNNIIWICEKKNILTSQFDIQTLKEKGYSHIYQTFHLIDYAKYKQHNWYQSVNISKFWGKPLLLIINRAFLTSGEKYRKITLPFHLIIHDECHSIINKTTQTFYNYMINYLPHIRCIGFSATPELTIKPYEKTITYYSIYDAVKDGVILPPLVMWIKKRLSEIELIEIFKKEINKLPYKKIVIWTGMIKFCENVATTWQTYFPDFLICVDTSKTNNLFRTFDDFNLAKEKAILFCACKHREGSDIRNLDGCIFLDGVSNRNSRTFIQCIGRVLRKDKLGKKKYGLIIDTKINSVTKVCDKMTEYFNLSKYNFPWKYNTLDHIHTLTFSCVDNIISKEVIYENDIFILKNKFTRPIPNDNRYHTRLEFELNLLKEKKVIPYIVRAIEILDLTRGIPHVTRGSCGSSLVCYLLGISHTDPIIYQISFSRFLNEFRETLPDIDFDFPYNIRDDIFFRIQSKWPGKVARISNHVYYHDKSAVREALRFIGIRKFIAKEDINKIIHTLSPDNKKILDQKIKELNDTFRCYSLHCGGLVFYPNGIPQEDVINQNKKIIDQVKHNKEVILKDKNFKIDILSSRALSQLSEILGVKDIDFSQNDGDLQTSELLSRGDNIGITLAESPLMRKALLTVKPKCIKDIAICLSIIRPMASSCLYDEDIVEYDSELVFDDDAIYLIKDTIQCSEAEADRYRRGLSKNKKVIKEELLLKLSRFPKEKTKILLSKLKHLGKYSFCKSHAYSYAQLVWQLAYCKAHYPKKFWISSLNHSQSNYRKWVHLYQAHLHGINYLSNNLTRNDTSIYSKNRNKKIIDNNLSHSEKMLRYGVWNFSLDNFYPNCYFIGNNGIYRFCGIIASCRIVKKKSLALFLGVGINKYIEVQSPNKYLGNKFIVKGIGTLNRKLSVIYCDNLEII